MAVRLSVVMVHSSPATSNAERVSQGVVGELIGLSGFDLILVAPLDSLSETSTDRLTLSSLSSDIAVLDWKPRDVIQDSLNRIGVEGSRTRHAADPEVAVDVVSPGVQPRRLYLFNLMEFMTAGEVISSLEQLNKGRAVRTFSLAPVVKRPEVGETVRSETTNVVSGVAGGLEADSTPEGTAGSEAAANADASSQQSQDKSHVHRSAAGPAEGNSAVASASGPAEQDLDALIDQLDQLDP